MVTSFFRDPETFEELKRQVFPRLLQERPPETPIRIWVPGCASGEEPYSIAMVLLEYLAENDLHVPIQIFATDVSDAAIEKARVGSLDTEGRIREINLTAAGMLGRQRSALEGHPFIGFVHKDYKTSFLHELHRCRTGRTEVTCEVTLVCRAGRRIPVQVRVVPEEDADGNVVLCRVSITDIGRIKQAEAQREQLVEELQAKNAELERFCYTVSHDLRSPVVTICGFPGALKRDLEAGNLERMREDLAHAAKAAKKMEQLIGELLELSRVGRMSVPPEEVSLDDLAAEVLEALAGDLKGKNVRVEFSGGQTVLYGQRMRLAEVLQNLVENALKYLGENPSPRIAVGGWLRKNETICCVSDNGLGIESRFHEKIFGLFDKLVPKSEGTGVGLALVKRIVELHGGRVWVESDGPGKGSTFYFSLPPKHLSPLPRQSD